MANEKKVSTVNIPSLSISMMTKLLSESYANLIREKIPFKTFPSVMLWGPPGVGKSQGVRQIAQEIKKETGKKVEVTDVRLLLFNPIDLRGIPVASEDRSLAIWLKPKIFQMDPSDDVVNILFLDEISAAPQSVQAAAYQITLDRVVGEHRLPENCIVIAAGNRVTDKSVSFKMPKALANRLLHIEITENFTSWQNWAVKSGIHAKVLGYLSFKNQSLFGFDASNDDLAFATPRSWEMVSNILNYVNEDEKEMFSLISGLVGVGEAMEFRTWCKIYADLPKVEDIFNGKTGHIPSTMDALYALVFSMTAYAREHRYELGKIRNSISYALRLPVDFSALLLKNYQNLEEGYENYLNQIEEYTNYLQKRMVLRNGKV